MLSWKIFLHYLWEDEGRGETWARLESGDSEENTLRTSLVSAFYSVVLQFHEERNSNVTGTGNLLGILEQRQNSLALRLFTPQYLQRCLL
jgi:hypothetical protein